MVQLDHTHRELLDVGEEKKQAVIKNNVNELIPLMVRESKLLKIVEAQESQRLEAVQQVLRERGIKSRLHLNVGELSRLVFDPEEKMALANVQTQLAATLQSLKRQNELNKQLIEQALTYIEYSINLFSYQNDEETVYHHPSEQGNHRMPKSGFFDTRG